MIVDQAVVAGRTGTFYVGLAPLKAGSSGLNETERFEEQLVANATFSYAIRSNTAGCYYYDEKLEVLSSEGCLVSRPTPHETYIHTKHL